MSYFVKVLADVLGVLYQNTGAALLLAALAMCIYILGKKQGAGPVVQAWIRQFRTSSSFRNYFFLMFYTGIILFHTLLCQKISGNPLANISGTWGERPYQKNAGSAGVGSGNGDQFQYFPWY